MEIENIRPFHLCVNGRRHIPRREIHEEMRRTILLAATLALPLLTSAQDTSLNHVVVRKALDEAGATFQTTVTYFDGLGRPVQTSTDAMSDTGAFTVTARRYDCRGLACEEWLPLAGGTSPSRVADPS